MQFTVTRTRTYHVEWIKRDAFEFTPRYEHIRSRFRRKMNTCFKCRHRFKHGEMMALGSVLKLGNQVFCRSCADQLEGGS